MSRKIIILIGPPCSGKSTIGKIVACKISRAHYISSGDIARKMAEKNCNIKNDLDNGRLAPEHRMRENILLSIKNAFINNNHIIILDGFPRFYDQLRFLYMMIPLDIDIKCVLVYAKLSTIIERSNDRNRSDDKSLEQRLYYYYNKTFKDLHKYINHIIDTDELSTDECVESLIKFIKGVEQGGSKNC